MGDSRAQVLRVRDFRPGDRWFEDGLQVAWVVPDAPALGRAVVLFTDGTWQGLPAQAAVCDATTARPGLAPAQLIAAIEDTGAAEPMTVFTLGPRDWAAAERAVLE
ncbi:hypothetical protein [Nocardia sp. NPDC051570]|uniref:hypothetical protein n=1 Tax=Nocardia sp. NPDC051570 TaxID=3364324 RepID=UPI0037BD8D89